MRGKRSKQYRKLMQQYSLAFGFREPYQVVVDAAMLYDTHRFAMHLAPALSRTLHGPIKAMITQCSIRHLYAISSSAPSKATTSSTPPETPAPSTSSSGGIPPLPPQTKTALLDIARTLTLRRCNHHHLPAPLSPSECLASVIDPKNTGTNTHRLVLAAQDDAVRSWARGNVRGVPAIYVRRSVMLLESMSGLSVRDKEGWERGKLRGGLAAGEMGETSGKRMRSLGGEEEGGLKRIKRVRGPNPLSVKKKKNEKGVGQGGKGKGKEVKTAREKAGAGAARETEVEAE